MYVQPILRSTGTDSVPVPYSVPKYGYGGSKVYGTKYVFGYGNGTEYGNYFENEVRDGYGRNWRKNNGTEYGTYTGRF